MNACELIARRHSVAIIMHLGRYGPCTTGELMPASENKGRARYRTLMELIDLGVVSRSEAVPYHNIHNTKMHELTEKGRRIYEALRPMLDMEVD